MEVVEVDSKRRNGRNDKRKLKNQIFPFRMTMRNELKGGTMLQAKEDMQADFTQSCEMLQTTITTTVELLISYNHVKLAELVQNGHFVVKLQIA